MRFDSPLRYPGGKSTLAPLIARTIEANGLFGCSYHEPFAGGAGAALRLLREGVVSELYLNDLDPHIISFWYAVLNEADRFAKEIMSIPLSIDEWRKQLEIYRLADASEPFKLGFATFYLNRCNRSGIIFGAAPIGGYQQAGEWKIGARFYRENLSERILAIGARREQIHVTNLDALSYLKEVLTSSQDLGNVFAYLDPPYFSNGNRLYMSSYDNRDHVDLARYIQCQTNFKWIMSYDDTKFIRDLYAASEIAAIPLEYSLQGRRQVRELLISPSHVLLASPPTMLFAD